MKVTIDIWGIARETCPSASPLDEITRSSSCGGRTVVREATPDSPTLRRAAETLDAIVRGFASIEGPVNRRAAR